MKFCTQCGRQAEDDNQQFCPSCGALFTDNTQNTQPDGAGNGSMPPNGMNNYNGTYRNNNQYYNGQPPYGQQLPMKWYNFLIYFGLFAGAVINVVTGIMYLTGKIYDIQFQEKAASAIIYSFFKNLQTLDIIYGIILIAFAAFGIFVRQQLAHYKKGAPGQLLAMYGVSCGVQIVYIIIQIIILNISTIPPATIGSVIGSLIGTVVSIVLNNIYFKKRAHLFRN